jgi:hypothetical protein
MLVKLGRWKKTPKNHPDVRRCSCILSSFRLSGFQSVTVNAVYWMSRREIDYGCRPLSMPFMTAKK